MEYEITTEAFSDIHAVRNCTKNPSHENFINFNDFSKENLPEGLRRDEVYNYVREIGLRVVRLTVKKDDGGYIYGTGAVYKARDSFGILTNDHIVSSQTEVQNCSIDFFFHRENDENIQTCHGVFLWGCSEVQDKSLFTFHPVPDAIRNMDILDNADSVCNVSLTHSDGTVSFDTGIIVSKWHRWFLHIRPTAYDQVEDRNNPVISCTIEFRDKTTDQIYLVTSTELDFTDCKIISVEIPGEQVPQFVKDFVNLIYNVPWQRGNRQFIPLMISHPHGGPKMISMGKLLDVKEEGHVMCVYHTAETCPGSSGGLLMTLGGDTSPFCGYGNTLGVHCKGDNTSQYNGVVIENNNLNISMFNT